MLDQHPYQPHAPAAEWAPILEAAVRRRRRRATRQWIIELVGAASVALLFAGLAAWWIWGRP